MDETPNYSYSSDDENFNIDEEIDRVFLPNENANDVAIKNLLLHKSSKHFDENNEMASIYYQTIAIAIGIRLNYSYDKSYSFVDFNEIKKSLLGEEKKISYDYNDHNQKIFQDKSNELPEEWTVIQLSRAVNVASYFSTKSDILLDNSTIYLSLLKYPHSKMNENQPICLQMNLKKTENVFADQQKFVSSLGKLTDTIALTDNATRRRQYAQLVAEITKNAQELTMNLKKLVGPWVCLFRGKSKAEESIKEEQDLKSKINLFCSNNRYSNRTKTIIFLIARSINLLSIEQINEFVDCLRLSERKNNNLKEFLKQIYNESQSIIRLDLEFYPCLMIIDELLDQFPWELLIPDQEFTRLFSFDILYSLYKRYKSKILNGYLHKRLVKGSCVINPDKSLNGMEQRMSIFFEYWTPDWMFIRGKPPTNEESIDFLKNYDVFIYCGHGSGLQNFKGNHILELDINCIAFLFGCSSVGFIPTGLNLSMIGSHVYYHLANCPTVIGAIFTVTDVDCDIASAIIVTRIISSDKKADWSFIDNSAWNIRKLDYRNQLDLTHEKNIQKIIAAIRCDNNISLKMKMALVIRGLPMCNEI